MIPLHAAPDKPKAIVKLFHAGDVMHNLHLAPIFLLSLTVPSVAIAQAKPSQAYSAAELSLIANLSFQSAAKEASLKRLYDARLDKMASELKERDFRIRQLERASGANLSQLASLKGQLANAKQQFLDELAAKDRDFARERAALTNAATDLLQTPDGRAALQLYLSGAPGSAEQAFVALDKLSAKRMVANYQGRGTDYRATAALALDAANKGRVTLAVAAERYEKVVAVDPDTFWDWIELSRLYQRMLKLDKAATAAAHAVANAQDDRDRSSALKEVGDILQERGDLVGALARYQQSLVIDRALAQRGANSAWAPRDLLVGLNKTGDILKVRGDLTGALSLFEEGLGIARMRLARYPNSAEALRDLAISLGKVGYVLLLRKDFTGSLARFEEALAIDRKLAAMDPSSMEAQTDLSISLIRIGSVLLARGDSTGALASYQASLILARSLVNRDASSAYYQQLLSEILENIGNIFLARQDLTGARARFEESLTIRRALVAQDPSSATAQRNLFVSLVKLTNMGAPGHRWADVLTQIDEMARRNQILSTDQGYVRQVRDRAAAEAKERR